MPAFDPTVLASLNGVSFAAGSLGSPATFTASDPNGLAVDPTQASFRVTFFTQVNTSAFTITNVNATYSPAGYNASIGGVEFPTFGSFTGTMNGVSTTYYIHAVSSDSLLISTVAHFEGSGGGVAFVLSNNDLGVGPTSVGYPDAATLAAAFASDTPSTGVVFGYYDVDGYGYNQLRLFDLNGDGVADPNVGSPFTGNPNPPTFPLTFSNDASAYVAPVCFVEGTRILTARGEVAVEDLVEGDEVVTATGERRPAIWIGSRRMRCDRHPRPTDVYPVRVRAGAFGDGLPVRDLRLSPGHAVAMDGVLVPVSQLTNGATIVQEPVETVRYFHVELDAHDVILAEGLACESYFDDDNRQVFGNAPGHLALYGRLDPQDWDQACLPVLRPGPRSEVLRQGLIDRAQALGWTLDSTAQLALEADGQAVAPVFSTASRHWFLVPAARRVVLRSPASIPALATPRRPDPRRLGVALSDLRIDGQTIDLASDALDQGFHPLEQDGTGADRRAWRWTDGAAELPATPTSTLIEIAVSIVSPRWVAPDQTFNQASPVTPRLRLVEAG